MRAYRPAAQNPAELMAPWEAQTASRQWTLRFEGTRWRWRIVARESGSEVEVGSCVPRRLPLSGFYLWIAADRYRLRNRLPFDTWTVSDASRTRIARLSSTSIETFADITSIPDLALLIALSLCAVTYESTTPRILDGAVTP
jgi:hypothetical protein